MSFFLFTLCVFLYLFFHKIYFEHDFPISHFLLDPICLSSLCSSHSISLSFKIKIQNPKTKSKEKENENKRTKCLLRRVVYWSRSCIITTWYQVKSPKYAKWNVSWGWKSVYIWHMPSLSTATLEREFKIVSRDTTVASDT